MGKSGGCFNVSPVSAGVQASVNYALMYAQPQLARDTFPSFSMLELGHWVTWCLFVSLLLKKCV